MPAVTFQVDVDYVDVDVTVRDRDGNFVSNLDRDDFEVFEDGKRQKIDTFSYVEIPVVPEPRFLGRAISPDTRSNTYDFTGRVYVLVLDDLDISPLRASTVKRAAREFLERHLSSNDIAAVVFTSGRVEAAQDFTSDRGLLLAAVDRFVGLRFRSSALDKLDAFYQQILDAAPIDDGRTPGGQQPPSPPTDTNDVGLLNGLDRERTHRAREILSKLQSISGFLANMRGRRKAVLLFSEGIDYPMDNLFGVHGPNEVLWATEDTIAVAARSNVNVFAIDPRGLVGLTSEFLDMQGLEASSVGQTLGVPTSSDVNANAVPISPQTLLANELRMSQDNLRALAEETGGFATLNSNSLGSAFTRIVDQNSRYYVIGYTPPNHPRNGKFHKIEVRVKRPDVRVQARRGYASPRGKSPEERKKEDAFKRARTATRPDADNTSSELRDVLTRPMQQSGLSFTVHAAPFRGRGKDASIVLAIDFDGEHLQFEPQKNDTVYASSLEISLYGVDQSGSPQQGIRSELKLALKRENYEWVKNHGLRVNSRLPLAPGRYQVRVGARDSGSGRAGSVFYDLEVPDFAKDRVMLSGLLLSAPSEEDAVTVQPDTEVKKVLPGGATSRRQFRVRDVLKLYAELYDNVSAGTTHTVDVHTRLISETGREVFAVHDEVSNSAPGDSGPWMSYVYASQIALKSVPPGPYLLSVEAGVRGEEKRAVRETLITVKQ
jgi:VWFA-related protein